MSARSALAAIALLLASSTLPAQRKAVSFSACSPDPKPFRAARGSADAARRTKFSEEEQRALVMVTAISYLQENACESGMGRPCTLDELIRSVRKTKAQKGDVIGLARDPRDDPDYKYSVFISVGPPDISAIPKREGLGGFLVDFAGIHFNPKGPAMTEHLEPIFSLEIKDMLCDPQSKPKKDK